jgi:NTE family protein
LEPLHSAAGNTEYRLLDVNRVGGAESALVLVALSGGGKRSAAFGHGVLRGMRDIPVRPEGKDSTPLDEVDLLAGVSGGTFPAAHFGLYGQASQGTPSVGLEDAVRKGDRPGGRGHPTLPIAWF